MDDFAVEPLHSIADVQRLLGVSRPTVSRMLRRGDIPVVEVGGRTLIDPSDLRRFVASRKRSRGHQDDGPVAPGPVVRSSGDAGAEHGAR